MRLRAAEFVGLTGDERAVEPLIRLLRDKDPNVRAMAARSLGELGDRRAVGPLIEALNHESGSVRTCVAEALAKFGERRAIPPLVEMLRGRGPRDAAARALAAFGRAAVEPLIGLLDHPNKDVRFFAAGALGEIGDPSAAGPLTKLLGDEYIIVRKKAAQALAEIGRASVPHLLEVLERGGREALVSACEALGELGDGRAVEPLKRLLGHEDELVRLRASQALRRLGS